MKKSLSGMMLRGPGRTRGVLCLLSTALLATNAVSGANQKAPSTAQHGLTGDKAVQTLRQQGRYTSLMQAVAQARYGISPIEKKGRATGSYYASNLANDFNARFTPTGVQITPGAKSSTKWNWGLRLRGYGYDPELQKPGQPQLVAQDNRLEYRFPQSTDQSGTVEGWGSLKDRLHCFIGGSD